MSSPAVTQRADEVTQDAWHGFRPGLWNNQINVRDFIQQNVNPYFGDEQFLTAVHAAIHG